jgi:hypothetical protein
MCISNETSNRAFFGQYDNGTQTPVFEQHLYNSTIYYFEGRKLTEPYIITMKRSGEVDNTTTVGVDIDRTQCDYLAVNGVNCLSCTYCGDEMYKADCTNIMHGRVTANCESSTPVLFPFLSSIFTSL